jgi:hypothetical protein
MGFTEALVLSQVADLHGLFGNQADGSDSYQLKLGEDTRVQDWLK